MFLKPALLAFAMTLFSLGAFSHPMPHSLMLLDVERDAIRGTLSLPLNELQFVYPHEGFDKEYKTLIQRKQEWLDNYVLQHLSVLDPQGVKWNISVVARTVSENEQPLSGKYHELTYRLLMKPPPGSFTRHFAIRYDVIMHQLVTHKLFIGISSDWYGGKIAGDSLYADLGVLMVNPADGSIPPVIVNLEEGSIWKGFKTMVLLGIRHITEGTDHLLFLFVLLLPCTLIAENRRWKRFGGTEFSVFRLAKLVTAFTIGHTLSLLMGATKWLVLPAAPVEIAIGFTILITAIHAIRPIFFRRELFVALGFGLIHGLAFAGVIAQMSLAAAPLAWSILGFNLGIELMQLFVIVCILPWLIILSKNNFYRLFRLMGGGLALIAAIGWIAERISLQPNFISASVEKLDVYGKYIVLAIAACAILSILKTKIFLPRQVRQSA